MNRPIHRSCPCGWTGSYTTDGYADKAQAAHSCDVDWSPKPCEHGGIHRHGTRSCRNHCGCRCEPCRIATADAEAAMIRARAYGRTRLVDATAAREHAAALNAAGMGTPRIAEAAGLHRDVVDRLIVGRHGQISMRITRATEAAILRVIYNPADGAPAIDGGPTARRLRSLVALGWWPSALARELGMEQAYVDRLLRGKPVRPGTARRLHAAYIHLADAEPPTGTYATRARRQDAERGWTPPLRIAGRLLAGPAVEQPEATTKRRSAA